MTKSTAFHVTMCANFDIAYDSLDGKGIINTAHSLT